MQGLLREPPLAGDWFKSGDIGYRDAEGCGGWSTARRTWLISGGEKSTGRARSPCCWPIRASRGGGGRAPGWALGRMPVAVVVTKPGAAIDAAEVLAAVDGRLARFKHSARGRVRPALPRNAMARCRSISSGLDYT